MKVTIVLADTPSRETIEDATPQVGWNGSLAVYSEARVLIAVYAPDEWISFECNASA